MLDKLATRYPDESIEFHLLRAMFAGGQVDEMKKTVAAGGNLDELPAPLFEIVKSLHENGQSGVNSLTAGDLHIKIIKGEN